MVTGVAESFYLGNCDDGVLFYVAYFQSIVIDGI